ncbi:MAG: hypothetical protein FWF81_12130 [Defluviitaleaceae bacterium]|nr:hypothetical protein [Defluviitaleaceae bacterium]
MNIIKHEIKKIIMFPAIIGFVLLSLSLNIVVVATMQNSYANFIADASRITGVNLGTDFNESIGTLGANTYADMLRVQTQNRQDVLYSYNTRYLADVIVEWLELSGLSERLMRNKYERFQYAAYARQAAGDSMTLYFAEITAWRHEALFEITMGLLLFQGAVLATLIMLLSIGYESNAKTELVVYSTKVGRNINRHKLIAGVAVSFVAYILLAAITLALYFMLNPMGGTWGSSVSSGFNFIRDGMMTRPFVTWHSFTVFEYLLASIGISVGLVLCFALMAYAIGLLIKNSYVGFLVIIALKGVLLLLPSYSPFMMLNLTITKTPICLVILRGQWFTDGGANVIWPNFEIVGVIGSLVVLAIISLWSVSRFKVRNLV